MRINQLDPPKNTYGPPIGGPYIRVYLPIVIANAYYLFKLRMPNVLQLQTHIMQWQI